MTNLTDKQYNTLKWIVQALLPALITFIGTVGSAVGWEYTELTMTIIGAFMALLGTSLGISSSNYYGEKNGK